MSATGRSPADRRAVFPVFPRSFGHQEACSVLRVDVASGSWSEPLPVDVELALLADTAPMQEATVALLHAGPLLTRG